MTSEVDAIIACNAAGKTGCFAGYTTNGKHAPGSYHGKDGTDSPTGSVGLAVDFDAFGTNAAKLKACAQWFMDKYGSKLAELIHSPMGLGIKDGKVVNIKAFYGVDTYKAHFNHVHVAVRKGVFLISPTAPTKEQAMTLVIEYQGVGMVDGDNGWAFGRRGHVYQFGNVAYYGGWDDNTRSGDRTCIALAPTVSGKGYWLVSNRGELYAYGDAAQIGNYQAAWGDGIIVGAWCNHKVANGGVTLLRDDGKNLNRYALPA